VEQWLCAATSLDPARNKPDHLYLKPAAECTIAYPKPDGKLTFDRLQRCSSAAPTTREPASHLTLKDASVPVDVNLAKYAGPSSATARPACTNSSRTSQCRQAAPADQCTELRALQDLRHQGPDTEHSLGDTRRRRRPNYSGM
jgi:electron-transferring-flavoprotein dehydrogenase